MSKLSFRARAVDAAKPLPVYRNTDVPDLADCACISRGVPPLPTGMETEEEREHHLQRAMSAQQVFRDKKDNMVIPVPEAETHTAYYDRLYRGHVKVPKQLIHIQPLSLDLDQPDYDLDSEDESLLNRLNRKTDIKPLRFEIMMDRLEKASTHQLVSVSEAKRLLDEDDVLLKTVYDYWLRKRRTCLSPSLTPGVKQERRDGSNNSDAYVAFRRRTEKMQTRKNRKSDEVSYEKMLRLRRDFSRSVSIVQMIRRREEAKRELLLLTLEEVQRRYQLEDFGGETFREVCLPVMEKHGYCSLFTLSNNTKVKKKQLLVRDELPFNLLRPKKKNVRGDRLCLLQRCPGRPPGPFIVNRADIKQYDFHSSGDEDSPPPLYPPSSPGEENNPDGVFVFRRTAGCQYLSPCTEPARGPDSPDHRHSLTELLPHWTRLSRRRRGRGGRIVLDRASSCLDPLLRQLDSLTRTSTCLLSDPPRTTAHSLTEVLNNIQNLTHEISSPCEENRPHRTASPPHPLNAPPFNLSSPHSRKTAPTHQVMAAGFQLDDSV
ncbi:enhancer of polycomb homolog 2-like [Plectropomus leopardus]|uniref:enhancer of polycomb homolog 2-like n=1 Tax=Plectropomus leopardus TaxID=160734 RepID=UPI001C4B7374|nr:enhancer of polycomb homolog 2-like [Plectropomus leopardus]